MSTRFYLPIAGYPAINRSERVPLANDAAWIVQASSFARLPMRPVKHNSLRTAINHVISATPGPAILREWISPPLIGNQTITGTLSFVILTFESAAGGDGFVTIGARVLKPDNSVRGTLLSVQNIDTEMPFADVGTRIASAVALSSVAALDGDRIALAVGVTGAAGSGATLTIKGGDELAVADFALTSGLNTDLTPWVEFSQDIVVEGPTPIKSSFLVPASSATSSATLAATVPAGGVATGKTAIVEFAWNGTGTTAATCADSKGNTYVLDAANNLQQANGLRLAVFSAHIVTPLVAGDTITCTAPASVSRRVIRVRIAQAILRAAARLDKTASGSGNSTAPSSGATAATGNADELAVGVAAWQEALDGQAMTVGAGYSDVGTTEAGPGSGTLLNLADEQRVLTATGAQTATGTIPAIHQWAMSIVTYQTARVQIAPADGEVAIAAAVEGVSAGSDVFFPAGMAYNYASEIRLDNLVDLRINLNGSTFTKSTAATLGAPAHPGFWIENPTRCVMENGVVNGAFTAAFRATQNGGVRTPINGANGLYEHGIHQGGGSLICQDIIINDVFGDGIAVQFREGHLASGEAVYGHGYRLETNHCARCGIAVIGSLSSWFTDSKVLDIWFLAIDIEPDLDGDRAQDLHFIDISLNGHYSYGFIVPQKWSPGNIGPVEVRRLYSVTAPDTCNPTVMITLPDNNIGNTTLLEGIVVEDSQLLSRGDSVRYYDVNSGSIRNNSFTTVGGDICAPPARVAVRLSNSPNVEVCGNTEVGYTQPSIPVSTGVCVGLPPPESRTVAYVADERIGETTTTTGTTNFTLAGAIDSTWRRFLTRCIDGDMVAYYAKSATEWESGLGYWRTGNILERAYVRASSNGNAKVSFAAGPKEVRNVLLAVENMPQIISRAQTLNVVVPPTGLLSVSGRYKIHQGRRLMLLSGARFEVR